MGNKVTIDTELKDGVSKKLGGIAAAFDKIGGKGSSASLFGNVGAKAVAAGFNLVGMAAGAVTGLLGDAITAAQEEEVSIARLDTALKANIPAWDGNRTAIESVLQARMALGFADDDQRASLALLVVATNDVSKALELQRTAMDLARLKGISLEEASNALIKVEGGQYRILKSLGIQIADNATQTDVLRAVENAAAGQAAAYAATNEGKLLVSQVKVGEAMETLGTAILPMVAAALGFVADFVSQLVREIKNLVTWVGNMIGALERGIKKVNEFLSKIKLTRDVGHDPIGDFIFGAHAAGGWVGLDGPEIGLLGEKGPEYITPNHKLGRMGDGGGGGGDVYLDGEKVGRILSKRLARDFRRASLTTSRV